MCVVTKLQAAFNPITVGHVHGHVFITIIESSERVDKGSERDAGMA